jgi:ATP synthase protein I
MSGVNDGWSALSYLISGVLLWGGVGWLIDAWLGTRVFVAIGLVLGAAGGVGMVWLRYSAGIPDHDPPVSRAPKEKS